MKVSALFHLSSVLAVASALALPRQQLANVYTSCTVPNTAALTFDDGPYIWHKNVVDTLDAAGVKGTFFMNGNNWDCIYDEDGVDRVQYSYSRGHQIGSHTWGHDHLATLTADQLEQQFSLSDTAFQKILGVVPTFMRPPYGEYNDLVLETASNHNQQVIIWDLDSGDSDGDSVEQSEQIYTNAIDNNPSNILTLNHETYQTTVEDILPFAIQALQDAGYNLVTVAECLGYTTDDMYQQVTEPSQRDDSWTCAGTPGPGQP
ncbi:carbohydrate esterase family 4 protein [Botryobasidium botryosum FD-172 SS1]|uniref:Carbohydrate esterase family 4 protein n=1 Tax=Botryobasidium botryosum (strain FD-172 SS1) TaxID=930990 RepID=A0A067MMZ1_BOTB1|nr:carbohydrate esterase family 4 protein [Botryobasidium botryosum FD-172 SS1]